MSRGRTTPSLVSLKSKPGHFDIGTLTNTYAVGTKIKSVEKITDSKFHFDCVDLDAAYRAECAGKLNWESGGRFFLALVGGEAAGAFSTSSGSIGIGLDFRRIARGHIK